MNTTTMLIILAILIIGYPFFLHYKLNSFKKQLTRSWAEIEKLLIAYENEPLDELAQKIHKKRRAYNTLVRGNNHKLQSKLAKFLAKKYDFETTKFFEFQGR
jgi:hypothetical protein